MWLVAIVLDSEALKKCMYFMSSQQCFMDVMFCGCNLVNYRVKGMFREGEVLPLKAFLGLLQHRENEATEALKLYAVRQMHSCHRMF